MRHFCRSERAKTASMPLMQPGGAIRDDQHRVAQPALGEPVKEARPSVGGFGPTGLQPDKHWLAIGGDAPRRQHRLTPRAGVHLEHGRVQKQVVQVEVIQPPLAPRRQLLANGPAHRRDRRLAQRRLRAEGIGQRRLHIPGRQSAHEPGNHQRLQRIRPGDALAEQPRAELLGRAAQLRPLNGHRPGGGLDRARAVAVAAADPRIRAVRRALVASATEELAHLGLHRGLDDQLGAQPGDLLKDLDQILRTIKQGIDLTANLLTGRYSNRHGRSPSFVDFGRSRRNLRPSSFTPGLGHDRDTSSSPRGTRQNSPARNPPCGSAGCRSTQTCRARSRGYATG